MRVFGPRCLSRTASRADRGRGWDGVALGGFAGAFVAVRGAECA